MTTLTASGNLGESGQNGLCKLVLFCYVAVFAVMPLAHIHVEPQNTAVSFVENAGPPSERFLVVLHEALSLYVKDRADLARLVRTGFTGKIAAVLSPVDARAVPAEPRQPRSTLADRGRSSRNVWAAPGASLCRSGLSPPPAIPSYCGN